MSVALGLDWLREHPEIANIRAASCDLNGIWRGKRVPVEQMEKLLEGSMRMPISALALDIWGSDVEDSPLVFETGDRDGYMLSTGRGLLPIDWVEKPSAMLPMWMVTEEGVTSPVDPRQILAAAVARAKTMGFTPVMAIELEFYLVDPSGDQPETPFSPTTNKRLNADSILSVDEIDQFEGFFAELYTGCRDQGISVDTAISESGRGQFEVNLLHSSNPLKSADDAVFFKRIVKGIARTDNLAATFMAKPYAERSGSGLHVHFSLEDESGKNVFDDGGEFGTDTLRHAIGGLLANLKDMALIWAPHLNSYRRLQPGSYAPTGIAWAYENRTAAIRVPAGSPKARRIEHRVAGADANPYLVLAGIIHGALNGIEAKTEPGDPIKGDAYALNLERLPSHWSEAINLFGASKTVDDHFPKMFKKMFSLIKLQEKEIFNSRISDFEMNAYLESV